MACHGCDEKKAHHKRTAADLIVGESATAVATAPFPESPRVAQSILHIRLELCKQCAETVRDEQGHNTEQYLPGLWAGRLHCGNPNNPDTVLYPERFGCGCAVEDRAIWEDAQCPRKKWGPGSEFRVDVVPMFAAPTTERLPGVIDYIGPTRTPEGLNDCAGIGDVMVQGVVVQAIRRFNEDRGIKVRFITVDGRLDWAKFAVPDVEVHSLSDPNRIAGEFTQHSAPLRALEIDATCRMQGQNRHQFLAGQFGVPPEYVTDWDVHVSKDAVEEADDFLAIPKRDGRPIVCVSPHANSPTRQWPFRHWCQLVDRLKKRGFGVFILHRPIPASIPDPIRSIPARRFGSNDPHRVAAVIAQSDIVLGCDSGMCHLAGILRKPALAICGPTEGSIVFGGWPTVQYVQAPGACTGCLWFQADGWQPWCGFGCGALADTKPTMVEPRVLQMLEENGKA